LVQQYVSEPAFPGVGELQLSDGYAAFGGSDAFEQEKPNPPPGQLTVESGEHDVLEATGRQQNSVEPALPAVPSLQTIELLESSGVSLPVQENPVPSVQATVLSTAQVEPPWSGLTLVVVVQPSPKPRMARVATEAASVRERE
jgi:hypothetical protein